MWPCDTWMYKMITRDIFRMLNNNKRPNKVLLCGVILVLLCLAAYKDALNGEFVFDDTVAISKNKDVINLPTNYSAIFRNDFWGVDLLKNESHKSFRPLTTLLFHYEYTLLQWRAKHMKAVNLLLHCLNTLLVWRFFTMTTKDALKEVNLLAAALFAVHPVHTEAVSGVVGRAELLFALCYLLALCSTFAGKAKQYVTILLFTTIGVLCKETAITIPLACVFVEFMQKRIFRANLRKQVKFFMSWKYLSYAVFTLALITLRLWWQQFKSPTFKNMDNPVAFHKNPMTRILSRNYVYALNFFLLLCPIWSSFDWAFGCIRLIEDIWDLRLQFVLALYTLSVMLLLNYHNNEHIILSFGLIVIPFLPASGIIDVGFVIAERVLYVPSIGFCYLISYTFVQFRAKYAKKTYLLTLMRWFILLLLLAFLMRTRARAKEWLTEETLFESALKVCPNNAKVHCNVARVATLKNNTEKAFYHYKQAIKLYPEYEAALMNLGNLYREKAELQTAAEYLRQAIKVASEPFPAAWMNLGIVLSAQGKYDEALKCYETALNLRKNYAVCHYNVGNLFLERKMYSEAMHHWQQAVAIDPLQKKAWTNIITLLDNRGLYEDALRISQEALDKHLPNETGILFIRANVFGKLKKYTEAETLYKRIIAVDPYNVLYHTNMGVLYHRWGKYENAIKSYETAIRTNAKQANTAKTNLDKLLKRLRNDTNSQS